MMMARYDLLKSQDLDVGKRSKVTEMSLSPLAVFQTWGPATVKKLQPVRQCSLVLNSVCLITQNDNFYKTSLNVIEICSTWKRHTVTNIYSQLHPLSKQVEQCFSTFLLQRNPTQA